MKVLLVCTGNTCRSPLAQVWLQQLCPAWEVRSAGVSASPGQAASLNSQRVAKENGLALENHHSQKTTAALLEWADRVLCVTADHRRVLVGQFPHFASKVAVLPEQISDPYGESLQRYQEASDQIRRALQTWVDQQRTPATNSGPG